MTEQFTPTTQQVRTGYATDPEAEYHDPITNHTAHGERAFDRWLAAHDAEVRDQALAEAEQRENEMSAHLHPSWDGDDAQIAILMRFVEHAAKLDSVIEEAREADGWEGRDLTFVWHDDERRLEWMPHSAPAVAPTSMEDIVRLFIDERVRYVESARQHRGVNNQGDYWRWQGHMESRRQLASQLGWSVPQELGERTAPVSQPPTAPGAAS